MDGFEYYCRGDKVAEDNDFFLEIDDLKDEDKVRLMEFIELQNPEDLAVVIRVPGVEEIWDLECISHLVHKEETYRQVQGTIQVLGKTLFLGCFRLVILPNGMKMLAVTCASPYALFMNKETLNYILTKEQA